MDVKLQKIVALTDSFLRKIFGEVRVYQEDNEFLIPWGSTTINVEVSREGEKILIKVYSPVALKVKPDKDLLRFLLTENAGLTLCSFWVEFEKGFLDIVLGLKFPKDFLSQEFLRFATISVGTLANEYSKEIIAVFGGISFKEYIDRESKRKIPLERKVLHDIFSVNGTEVSLEIYRDEGEDSYTIVGKIPKSGRVFIRASRKKDLNDVFSLLQKLKDSIVKGKVSLIKRILKHYEMDEILLYRIVFSGKEEKLKLLSEVEKEFNTLAEMLMKGEITHEEYRKKVSNLEKLLDAQE